MKSLVGKVTSTKMTGTVAITVDTFKMHPVYKKRLRRSKRYLAQAAEAVKVGDLVTIKEIRPASKSVHFKIEYILSRAEVLTDVKHATKDVEVSPESTESMPAKAHAQDNDEAAVVEEVKEVKKTRKSAKKDEVKE